MDPKNPVVYLEFSVDGLVIGTVNIELYDKIVPRTCNNFLQLCKNQSQLTYLNTRVHRVIKGFVIGGGDILTGKGISGKSIYGARFDDEGFSIKHDRKGVICMASAGPNTNNSMFNILLNPAPFLDYKSVAFGCVTDDSLSVLDEIVVYGTESDGNPLNHTVTITACGVVEK